MQPSKTIFFATQVSNAAVSKYYLALASELTNRGYQVVIITGGRKADKVSTNTNPAIYTWPSLRPTRIKDMVFLFKLIKRYSPVMILANFASVNTSILVSWLMGVPLRYATFRTSEKKTIQEIGVIKQKYLRLRKSIVYKLATKVLPVSEAMGNELIEQYNVPSAKVQYFHNAVEDPELFNELRPMKGQNLVCVAGLIYGKGQDVLIEAMPSVLKEYPGVKLYLIGSGEREQELMALTKRTGSDKAIYFLGQIDHKQVVSMMADAYVLVLPTRFEAFGLVIIEAMSVGTPVIASNIGGIPEIIRDGIDGILVPVEDDQALANAIKTLLRDPSLRSEMSKNVYERFLDKFELKKAVKKQADWVEYEMSQRKI